MWNMKCMVTRVINGVTGIVTMGLKKKIGSNSRKIFNRFTAEDGYIRDSAHNVESTAV
jgi:hypothetical protein